MSYLNLYLSRSFLQTKLRVTDDGIHGAIGDSMHLCKEILDKKVETITMRGE